MRLKKQATYVVSVVGATGAVGGELLEVLRDRDFPVRSIRLFASEGSEGETLEFEGSEFGVETLSEGCFDGTDIAFFSAGAEISKAWALAAVRSGCLVIDTSSQWRMDPNVPLVVPEINAGDLRSNKGIVASPGCIAIMLASALKPIHDAVKIKRAVVTTFESVSQAGKKAMDELLKQTTDLLSFQELESTVFPHQTAFNLFPHLGEFIEDGYTSEERGIVAETLRVLADDSLRISATAVLVPVFRGHSAAVNIETAERLSANEARSLLSRAPGVAIFDAPQKNAYPTTLNVAGTNQVYVGRVREDTSVSNGINMWLSVDNLRKGSALNAVMIAEELLKAAV